MPLRVIPRGDRESREPGDLWLSQLGEMSP
jgi:hypothetical protein